ncbi:MAG: IS5 family transposase [Parvularculaceae bacterium]
MPCTETTRGDYDRRSLRYASDGTDGEWELIAPFMPPRSKLGRPRRTQLRAVWNAIQYLAATGRQWAQSPKDFPPFTTVQYCIYQLRDSGVLDVINETLVASARVLSGRSAQLTAGVTNSQCVKTAESGGPRGYDAGKNIKRCKRHIVTDTWGHLLAGLLHAADIQDRDGVVSVITDMCASHPGVVCLFADGGYAGDKLEIEMLKTDDPGIEIVRQPDDAKGFVVIARRWVVERSFAWLGRCRRLTKDWEKTIASSEAWMFIASIRITSRKIARAGYGF